MISEERERDRGDRDRLRITLLNLLRKLFKTKIKYIPEMCLSVFIKKHKIQT